MLPKIIKKLLRWYDRYDDLNIVLAAFLFSIQIVHLIWLTANAVIPRFFGSASFIDQHFFNAVVAIVDYTEIPALISTSIVYARSYKKRSNKKDFLYLTFINIQWLHILWITDEFVIKSLEAPKLFAHWNHIAAWFAISIDYLELPVIFETLKRAFKITSR